MLIQREQKQRNLFFLLYFIYALMMITDFFLTSNPFSAIHSGKLGYYADSTGFFIVPAYLVLLTLFVATLYTKKLILDFKLLFAMGILLISGLYTEALFTNPSTYLYNFLAFTLVSSLAITTVKLSDKTELPNLKKVAKVITWFLIIGASLAIMYPYRYGVLPFEFSRDSRGEVTFWLVTALLTVYPIVALLAYRKYRIKRYIFFSLLMTLVVASTATRTHVILTLLPFIIVILFNMKLKHKLIATYFLIPVALFYYQPVIDYFTESSSGYDISTGRSDLWSYHWSYFEKHPILGSGAMFQERMGDYTGKAESEIGALSWFSENGIIFGTMLLLIVFRAAAIGIKLLSKGRKTTEVEMLFSLLVLSMFPNLIQGYGRILSLEGMIFWFSVFYLNAYRQTKWPYLVLFKK